MRYISKVPDTPDRPTVSKTAETSSEKNTRERKKEQKSKIMIQEERKEKKKVFFGGGGGVEEGSALCQIFGGRVGLVLIVSKREGFILGWWKVCLASLTLLRK